MAHHSEAVESPTLSATDRYPPWQAMMERFRARKFLKSMFQIAHLKKIMTSLPNQTWGKPFKCDHYEVMVANQAMRGMPFPKQAHPRPSPADAGPARDVQSLSGQNR
jgi:hypothetical protein